MRAPVYVEIADTDLRLFMLTGRVDWASRNIDVREIES